jgi:hypothetical protein
VEQLGIGVHEGDWEMVQVRLDAALQPDRVTYARHIGAQTLNWTDVEKADSGTRPVVYVANASHASYDHAGSNLRVPCPTDYYDGQNADQIIPETVEIRSDSPAWVAWPGKWGGSGASPTGPSQKGQQWSDPGTWSSGVTTDTCTG